MGTANKWGDDPVAEYFTGKGLNPFWNSLIANVLIAVAAILCAVFSCISPQNWIAAEFDFYTKLFCAIFVVAMIAELVWVRRWGRRIAIILVTLPIAVLTWLACRHLLLMDYYGYW